MVARPYGRGVVTRPYGRGVVARPYGRGVVARPYGPGVVARPYSPGVVARPYGPGAIPVLGVRFLVLKSLCSINDELPLGFLLLCRPPQAKKNRVCQ